MPILADAEPRAGLRASHFTPLVARPGAPPALKRSVSTFISKPALLVSTQATPNAAPRSTKAV